ncbi:MAG: M23 family metallopeptidase, partial [Solirubrobacterales bacterium]
HADWYVDEVLLYAKQYGNLPDDLVGSLTGLTEGARFPVAADARYADDISEGEHGKGAMGRSIDIFTRRGAPVIAVNDGIIERVGSNARLGEHVVLRDPYGNRFTYAGLGEVSSVHPVPEHGRDAKAAPEDERPSAGPGSARRSEGPANTEDARERVAAYPDRAEVSGPRDGASRLEGVRADAFAVYERLSDDGMLRFDRDRMDLEPLREGSKVVAGTVLGRIGDEGGRLAPHVAFAIRPAGRGAPRINPKPILDGWKLLEATAIYRAAGKDPFEDARASAGQVLLMSKEQLVRRVLDDPKVAIYPCGRQDVATGQIDRRVLALLGYLSASGFRLGVTSLQCGHSTLTASGNVSNHSTGSAVDIATLNGLPVLGNQGRGSITETVVREVLDLQGAMVPDELISLMDLGGPSFAMSDHADHVHVGYSALDAGGGSATPGTGLTRVLKPRQWKRLVGRLSEIENPKVPTKPSEFSTPAKKRASGAHRSE